MTTGEGIFYGLIFIGLIWLYVTTRDRWSWKKIAKWAAVVLVLPIVAFGSWAAYENYSDAQPRLQSEFWGVTLGMPKSELILLKGQPYIEGENSLLFFPENENFIYKIDLNATGNVSSVLASSSPENTFNFPDLQGINRYSSLADIEKKFGRADFQSTNKNGTMRVYSYLKYGVVIEMEKGRITSIGALNPADGAYRIREK